MFGTEGVDGQRLKYKYVKWANERPKVRGVVESDERQESMKCSSSGGGWRGSESAMPGRRRKMSVCRFGR